MQHCSQPADDAMLQQRQINTRKPLTNSSTKTLPFWFFCETILARQFGHGYFFVAARIWPFTVPAECSNLTIVWFS
jgi:hypothetical protein